MNNFNPQKLIIPGILSLIALVVLLAFWPIRTVPTGHRGVVTVGGAIKGVEGEGFTLVMPWQKLDVFNVRAEAAEVKGAEGATADQQPVRTSMTVRYSIIPNKVAEVFEQYSRDGNLDTYIVQKARPVDPDATIIYDNERSIFDWERTDRYGDQDD